MTGMLKVDTDALDGLADLIRRAAGEARAAVHDPGPLHASISALGVPALVHAADAFVACWSATLGDVVADAQRLADVVSVIARSYRDAESVSGRAFRP